MAKKITFALPAGAPIPKGKSVGDTYSAMVTFRIEQGGKVCVEEVDGEPLSNDKDSAQEGNEAKEMDDTTQPDESSLASLFPGGGK